MSSQIVITTGSKQKSPVDATGKSVLIAGNQCVFELTGKCVELRILGHGIKVKAEEIGSLFVAGGDSQITVTTLGKGSLAGSGNQLTWNRSPMGGDPQVTLHGVNNQARKA